MIARLNAMSADTGTMKSTRQREKIGISQEHKENRTGKIQILICLAVSSNSWHIKCYNSATSSQITKCMCKMKKYFSFLQIEAGVVNWN